MSGRSANASIQQVCVRSLTEYIRETAEAFQIETAAVPGGYVRRASCELSLVPIPTASELDQRSVTFLMHRADIASSWVSTFGSDMTVRSRIRVETGSWSRVPDLGRDNRGGTESYRLNGHDYAMRSDFSGHIERKSFDINLFRSAIPSDVRPGAILVSTSVACTARLSLAGHYRELSSWHHKFMNCTSGQT